MNDNVLRKNPPANDQDVTVFLTKTSIVVVMTGAVAGVIELTRKKELAHHLDTATRAVQQNYGVLRDLATAHYTPGCMTPFDERALARLQKDLSIALNIEEPQKMDQLILRGRSMEFMQALNANIEQSLKILAGEKIDQLAHAKQSTGIFVQRLFPLIKKEGGKWVVNLKNINEFEKVSGPIQAKLSASQIQAFVNVHDEVIRTADMVYNAHQLKLNDQPVYMATNMLRDTLEHKAKSVDEHITRLVTHSTETIHDLAKHANTCSNLPKYTIFKTKKLGQGLWKAFQGLGYKKMMLCTLPLIGWAADAHAAYEIIDACQEMNHLTETKKVPEYFVKNGDTGENYRYIVNSDKYQYFVDQLNCVVGGHQDYVRTKSAVYQHTPKGNWGDHEPLAEYVADNSKERYIVRLTDFCARVGVDAYRPGSYVVLFDGPERVYTTLNIHMDQDGVPLIQSSQEIYESLGVRKISASDYQVIYEDVTNLKSAYDAIMAAKQDLQTWGENHPHWENGGSGVPGRMSHVSIKSREKERLKQNIETARQEYMDQVLEFRRKHRVGMDDDFQWIKDELVNNMVQVYNLQVWSDKDGLPCYDIMPELRTHYSDKDFDVDQNTPRGSLVDHHQVVEISQNCRLVCLDQEWMEACWGDQPLSNELMIPRNSAWEIQQPDFLQAKPNLARDLKIISEPQEGMMGYSVRRY